MILFRWIKKEDIKAKIKEGNDKRAKAEYEEAVINLACENAKVDIPELWYKMK